MPCFLSWGKFNFYTTCAEVTVRLLCKLRRNDFWHRHNLCRCWLFNFCPTWTEVRFQTSNQLGRKWILKILPKLDRIFFEIQFAPRWHGFCAVDFSSSNVLTDRDNFFCFGWILPFEILNMMRELRTLDGISHYQYNNGTAVRRYINNWINCSTILNKSVHPTRYRHTGSAELLHHAFGSVGGSRKKAEPDFEFSEPIT